LITRRDAIYALIRELDADYQTGKINDEDYQASRQRFVAEGVTILKQLDDLSSEDSRNALEAEIEAKVRALRQKPVSASEPGGKPSVSRFCTQCGHPTDPEDHFCAQCGASLKGIAT
jgi:hypothetical protein